MSNMNGVAMHIALPLLLRLEGKLFSLADPLQTPTRPRYTLPLLILMTFLHLLLVVLLLFLLMFFLIFLIVFLLIIAIFIHLPIFVVIILLCNIYRIHFHLMITGLQFPIFLNVLLYNPFLRAYIHLLFIPCLQCISRLLLLGNYLTLHPTSRFLIVHFNLISNIRPLLSNMFMYLHLLWIPPLLLLQNPFLLSLLFIL